MTLFHRVVNKTVDVDALALLIMTKRSLLELNRVQYQTHSSKKDCYKYSFVRRSIIQWNNIVAPDDDKQFKSQLSSLDLHMGGDTYTDNNYLSLSQINDNLGSKYSINNNMVSVILKYLISIITTGLNSISIANVIFIHQI